MSFYKKTGEVIADWNKEEFRKLFHEDFLFIRETELVTLDDHINNFDKFMSKPENAKELIERRRNALVHENDFVTEVRFEEKGEIVTNVFLKKDSLGWRSIVNRVPTSSIK